MRPRQRALRPAPVLPVAATAPLPAAVRRRKRDYLGWDAYQTRTQLRRFLSLSLQQFIEQRRQQARTLLLRLGAPGQLLCQLPEHFGGAMTRGNLGDHLAVVGRGAEDLGFERNN